MLTAWLRKGDKGDAGASSAGAAAPAAPVPAPAPANGDEGGNGQKRPAPQDEGARFAGAAGAGGVPKAAAKSAAAAAVVVPLAENRQRADGSVARKRRRVTPSLRPPTSAAAAAPDARPAQAADPLAPAAAAAAAAAAPHDPVADFDSGSSSDSDSGEDDDDDGAKKNQCITLRHCQCAVGSYNAAGATRELSSLHIARRNPPPSLTTAGEQPAGEVVLVRCTSSSRKTEYRVQGGNIARVFAKFRHEGRATIRLRSPQVDIALSKADPAELDAFLTTLYTVHTDPDGVGKLPGTAVLQLQPITKERMTFESQQKLSVGPDRDL